MIKHYTVITLNAPPPKPGKRISEAHYAALRDAQANPDQPEEAPEIDSQGVSRQDPSRETCVAAEPISEILWETLRA